MESWTSIGVALLKNIGVDWVFLNEVVDTVTFFLFNVF